MEFWDVQRLEVVIRRFNFRAFDYGKADGEEDIFALLKDFTNQVMRANGADDSGEGEVDALASAGGFAGAGFDGFVALVDFGVYVGAELIQLLADDALEFLSGTLEPGLG